MFIDSHFADDLDRHPLRDDCTQDCYLSSASLEHPLGKVTVSCEDGDATMLLVAAGDLFQWVFPGLPPVPASDPSSPSRRPGISASSNGARCCSPAPSRNAPSGASSGDRLPLLTRQTTTTRKDPTMSKVFHRSTADPKWRMTSVTSKSYKVRTLKDGTLVCGYGRGATPDELVADFLANDPHWQEATYRDGCIYASFDAEHIAAAEADTAMWNARGFTLQLRGYTYVVAGTDSQS